MSKNCLIRNSTNSNQEWNDTTVILNLSSNAIVDSNYETDYSQKLIITDTHLSRFHEAFANSSSATIKLSNSKLYQMARIGGFLGKLLGPLLKTGLSLMKNVLKLLAKCALIPLRLIESASVADTKIHKYRSFSIGNDNINSYR